MNASPPDGIADLSGWYTNGGDPVTVTQDCLARIEQYQAYGAFVDVDADGAMKAANDSRERWRGGVPLSRLDGVPIAAKSNIAVAGMPWTAGIAAYRDRIADHDAAAIAAYRAGGAVMLGTLAMHEAAFGATTDNAAFGRCHNPWHHGYTPGGSSGGSAAAVALDLCVGALGTDTMGSVRLPSSYCGVFGHKPGFDLIPVNGVVPLAWTLDHVGVHARSAADCAALLAPFADVEPVLPHRIAAIDPAELEIDAEVEKAYLATLTRARSMGLAITTVGLPSSPGDLRRAGLLIVEAEAAIAHEAALQSCPEGFSKDFRNALAWAVRQPIERLAKAHVALVEARRALRRAWGSYEAVLLPTTPQTAFSFDIPIPANQADLTVLANVLGCPATAFPVGLTDARFPLSVQALGWEDAATLGLAEHLALPLPPPPPPPA